MNSLAWLVEAVAPATCIEGDLAVLVGDLPFGG